MSNEKTAEVKIGKRDRHTLRYLTERIYAIIKAADTAAYTKMKENLKAAHEAGKKSAVRKVEALLRAAARKRLEETVLQLILSRHGSLRALAPQQVLVDGKTLREQCEDIIAGEMPAEPSDSRGYTCSDGMEERFYFFLPESRDKMQAALDTLYIGDDAAVKALLSSLEKWAPKV